VFALLCAVVVLLSVAVAPYLSCGSVTLCCMCRCCSLLCECCGRVCVCLPVHGLSIAKVSHKAFVRRTGLFDCLYRKGGGGHPYYNKEVPASIVTVLWSTYIVFIFIHTRIYCIMFSSVYGTNQRVLNAIIEDQAFSPSYDLAPPPPPLS
jgi:hypothetical protein